MPDAGRPLQALIDEHAAGGWHSHADGGGFGSRHDTAIDSAQDDNRLIKAGMARSVDLAVFLPQVREMLLRRLYDVKFWVMTMLTRHSSRHQDQAGDDGGCETGQNRSTTGPGIQDLGRTGRDQQAQRTSGRQRRRGVAFS